MRLNLHLLNNNQYHAVTTNKKKVLVIAGAGSGKTRVITTRIAKLLSENVDKSDIAAFTFTNKAANEMKFRLKYLLEEEVDLSVQTFHSFAYSFITNDMIYPILGFSDRPNVIIESDKTKLIKEILEKYNTNYSSNYFIKAISKIKNKTKITEINNDDLELLNIVYHDYQTKLRNSCLIDFDDMIPLFIELLNKDKFLREGVQIKHLLVDEFQDTNNIQYELIQILSEEHKQVFCVSDDDQLIYSFRNSDIKILQDFQNQANELIILDHNYRCSKEILEVSNSLIDENQKRIKKVLKSNYESKTKVVYNQFLNQNEEAAFIVNTIKELVSTTDIKLNDIAVLYRNNNQVLLVEKELKQQNINYALFGGKPFFEYKEIKMIINTYRLIFNPRDIVAFDSIIKDISSLEPLTISKLKQDYNNQNKDIINFLFESNEPKIKAVGLKLNSLQTNITILTNEQFFNEIISTLKLRKYLKEQTEQKPQYLRIITLKEIIKDLDSINIKNSFNDLILENTELKVTDQVSLLTIHKSKGLEFKVVFVIGLNEGILPSLYAQKDDLEEERRLCYVAMTRAKKHLYLSSTNINYINGMIQKYQPSRFITEAKITTTRKSTFLNNYWYNR